MVRRKTNPGLKAFVTEASRALSRLDADRLEEMALSCKALVTESESEAVNPEASADLVEKDAARDMAILARVLEATMANLQVMRRLRDIRAVQLDYGPALAGCGASVESEHGDH